MDETKETATGLVDRSQERISSTRNEMDLLPVPLARFRFVFVNNVAPWVKAQCAFCGTTIEQSYLREPRTGLLYCDLHCLTGYQKITSTVRKVS